MLSYIEHSEHTITVASSRHHIAVSRHEPAYEHFATLGTFVQLPYGFPPVTATFSHVHFVQDELLPQVTTMLLPLLSTAPVPSMLRSARSVMGIPVPAVPFKSPPS